MTVEKKSKRQERREKMRKQEMRNRLITIGLITVGAALLVVAFIWPQFTTIDDLIIPETKTLPNPDGLSLGDPNAPAVIEVFEDFQCPACQFFMENIEPLIIQYLVETGKARLVFRHYPFIDGAGAGNGGESDQAANAAMCANEQGKFWDMQAVIYANWNGENLGNLSNRRLQAMAEAINLDMNAFNSCFRDNKYRDAIQADFDRAEELGVSGTPSVFVNGNPVGEPGKIASFQEIAVAVDAIVNAGE
ncbi:MAG: DsbA family protein [Anaerolineales bacterium]|nr:DsbA family protein [Anaerolineales bacterium]NUQ86022.1 thioredoxin domain-containing protein [Anaerolineales bacterium]